MRNKYSDAHVTSRDVQRLSHAQEGDSNSGPTTREILAEGIECRIQVNYLFKEPHALCVLE
jgi:hypothetical protein